MPPVFEAVPPVFEAPPDFEAPPSFEAPPALAEPVPFAGSGLPATARGRRALVFTAAARRWAVTVDQVVQVDRPGDVVPLPHVPAWLLGVTHLRGDIVSVIDLGALLGQAAAPPGERRLLVVRGVRDAPGAGVPAAGFDGFLVDRIEGVRTLGDKLGIEAAAPLEGRLAAHASGPWEAAGQPVYLTDLGALVASVGSPGGGQWGGSPEGGQTRDLRTAGRGQL